MRRSAISKVTALLLVLILLIVVGAGVYLYYTSTRRPTKELIIYHWWTAGGEKEAIDAVFAIFKEKYPDIKIVENPVAGGAGVTMKAVLKSLMVAGQPPDTFQVHAGAELKEYVDGGYVQPIDDLWNKLNLDDKFPPVLVSMVTINGHKYAIPINIHRSNWLWYNKHIFEEYGVIEKFGDPSTWDPQTFLEVVKYIWEASGHTVYPLALASRNKWPVTHLFENLLLAIGGPDTYIRFFTGRATDEDWVKVKETLEYMAELMKYVNPNHPELTWDQACALVAEGHAAMNIMGDWALGYFFSVGLKYGEDFGAVPVPGTQDYFLLLSDAFAIPKGAPHPDAAKAWLTIVADPEAQAEFNKIKGSIAARLDVPADVYPDQLRKQNVEDLKTKWLIPSATHGGIAPDSFMTELHNILTSFIYSGDVDAALQQIKNAAVNTNLAQFWAGVEDVVSYFKKKLGE